MQIKPIETVYRGTRYRSRLEAKWAVCFHALGLPYSYEREGFDLGDDMYYLPDFDLGTWYAEVKAQQPTDREREFARRLSEGSGKWVFILCGDPNPLSLTVYAYPPSYAEWQRYIRDAFVAWTQFISEQAYRQHVSDDPDVTLDEMTSAMFGLVTRALRAGGEARFEHGERPNV